MTLNIDPYVNPELLKDYKAYPGPEHRYYCIGDAVTMLLKNGLTEDSSLLDIGCGPLRVGRFLIPFLRPRGYCGIEPERVMLEEALREELVKPFGAELLAHKSPAFVHNTEFDPSPFERKFDFVLARAVFIHCGREQLRQCLANVKGVLLPNGKFFVQVSIKDRTSERPKGEGRPWSYRYASHAGACYLEDDFVSIATEFGYNPRRVTEHFWMLTQ